MGNDMQSREGSARSDQEIDDIDFSELTLNAPDTTVSQTSGDTLFLKYQLHAIKSVCKYPVYVKHQGGVTLFTIFPDAEEARNAGNAVEPDKQQPAYDPLRFPPIFPSETEREDETSESSVISQLQQTPRGYTIWIDDGTPKARGCPRIPTGSNTLWELDQGELNHCIGVTGDILSYEFPEELDGTHDIKNQVMRSLQALHSTQSKFGWDSDEFVRATDEVSSDSSPAGDAGRAMESLMERALRLKEVFTSVLQILLSPESNPYKRSDPQGAQAGGTRTARTAVTCAVLRSQAKQLGVKGVSRMTKDSLVKSIAALARKSRRQKR